jgi:beta-galactosidase
VAGGRHCEYFYELCDRAGLMVWTDTPFTGAAYPTDIDFVDTPRFRENGREQLSEMISQLWNHPCVVAWGLFSNVTTDGDDPVPYIRELNDLTHRLDPSRLTAGTSNKNGDINFITDLIAFDQSFGWDSGMPDMIGLWVAQLAREWKNLPAGLSYSAGASILHQSETLRKTVVLSNHHPEGWQTAFHEEYMRGAVFSPSLWGVFVGNMFDYGAARHVWGDGKGTNDHGLVTFDRKDCKDAYYLYKANWNTTDPFVYLVGKRLDTRASRRQTITVYSNRPSVELFVGGRSQGVRSGENGVFTWADINLRPGANRLEARAAVTSDAAPTTVSDRCTINIDPSAIPAS